MRTCHLLAAIGSAVALLCSSSESLAGEAAPDRELALEGKALYAEHCLHCHGLNMVNPGTVTYDLRAFPHGQKDRFVDSVINGKAGVMPPWGDVISLDDIDALWAYVLTGGHI